MPGYSRLMPRGAHQTPGGFVYHAANRYNEATAQAGGLWRSCMLDAAAQNIPCVSLPTASCRRTGISSFGPRPMANSATLLLRWLTLPHSVRSQAHYHRTGSGHVYQNRFKAFAVEEDGTTCGDGPACLCRAECSASRLGAAGRGLAMVEPGLSVGRRRHRRAGDSHPWPVPMPANWLAWVNEGGRPKPGWRACVFRPIAAAPSAPQNGRTG